MYFNIRNQLFLLNHAIIDVEKRQPSQAKVILPRIVVVIIIKVDEGLFSANRMESTANADMVVKAPNTPVPNSNTTSSLTVTPAATAPSNMPRSNDPTRFAVIVPQGKESDGSHCCNA